MSRFCPDFLRSLRTAPLVNERAPSLALLCTEPAVLVWALRLTHAAIETERDCAAGGSLSHALRLRLKPGHWGEGNRDDEDLRDAGPPSWLMSLRRNDQRGGGA
ncbi:hypothetical protein GJAV_G00001240 [Gymnothorax javanicus]|nr:hypothetical protein GJAV_G00001240 [Gymnothorax javanicus]